LESKNRKSNSPRAIASNSFLQVGAFSLHEHAPQTHAQLRSPSSRAQRLQPINPRHSFWIRSITLSKRSQFISGTLCVTHSAAIARSKSKKEGQVALEMGNLPKVVKDHYFEIIDERAAREHTADFKRVVSFRSPAKKSAETPSNGYDPRLFSSKKNNAV
jgi:hypothetical protein